MATNQINIKNRRASFDYEIIETFNAGIVLTGTEIKSIRQGKAGLTDTYCVMENGELWVKNMYIAEYSQGSYNNHVTHRDRKLLLNKKEIQKIAKAGEQPGYSIIPLRVFLNERGLAKMAIAIARGKKGEFQSIFKELQQEGFVRVKIDGEIYSLDEDEIKLAKTKKHDISVVVDRVVVKESAKSRITDSVQTALEKANGEFMV